MSGGGLVEDISWEEYWNEWQYLDEEEDSPRHKDGKTKHSQHPSDCSHIFGSFYSRPLTCKLRIMSIMILLE